MAKQITKNYYYEKNMHRLIREAECRVEELKIIREISTIDNRIKALRDFSILYPPPAGPETPLGVHTHHPLDQGENIP
jgi:hypothetical protein